MKRRAFLKTLPLAVGSTFLDPREVFSASAERGPMLAVVRGKGTSMATAKAVEILGGMSKFVSPGDVVLIKPNMAWDRVPEQAANTNPIVVATLAKLALEAGAKKVKVFDNTCNEARRCYKKSGIAEAARRVGAQVLFVEERKFRMTRLGGEVLKDWPVYREAMEVDKIINVPIAKHHSLSLLTLSMKNLMGLIGGSRNLLHQKIHLNIADLAGFFKPSLVVLDAVRILTANGPQGGSLRDVRALDTVAASTDQVAIDAFGATLFGLTWASLPYVSEAHKRGLGEKDLGKIRLVEKTLSS